MFNFLKEQLFRSTSVKEPRPPEQPQELMWRGNRVILILYKDLEVLRADFDDWISKPGFAGGMRTRRVFVEHHPDGITIHDFRKAMGEEVEDEEPEEFVDRLLDVHRWSEWEPNS